jgi:nucleotide-binding universal stress UspA family protein
MSRGRRVLVATDHHHSPTVALKQAAALAGPGGEVVLAAVLVVPMAQPLGASLEGAAAAACEVLERAERKFDGAFEFDTRLVRVRSFAEGVLQLLDGEPFDLLVLERRRGASPGDTQAAQIEAILERARVTVTVVLPAD